MPVKRTGGHLSGGVCANFEHLRETKDLATTNAASSADSGHLISLFRFFRTYFQATLAKGSRSAQCSCLRLLRRPAEEPAPRSRFPVGLPCCVLRPAAPAGYRPALAAEAQAASPACRGRIRRPAGSARGSRYRCGAGPASPDHGGSSAKAGGPAPRHPPAGRAHGGQCGTTPPRHWGRPRRR